jgi:hypothetical protein
MKWGPGTTYYVILVDDTHSNSELKHDPQFNDHERVKVLYEEKSG